MRPVRKFVSLCHTQLQKSLMRSWEEVGVVCKEVRWRKGQRKYYCQKYLRQKYFCQKYFREKYFWKTCFPTNIFGKNIYAKNIFGKNIYTINIFTKNIFGKNIFTKKNVAKNIVEKNIFVKNIFKKNSPKIFKKNTYWKYFSKKKGGGEAPLAARRA